MDLVKKKILHLAGIYVALIALFVALLWLLQLIPNSWMTEAQESFQYVWEEEYIQGGYPSPMFATGQSDLDIYSDNAMYERLTADEGMTALEAAMDMQDYPRYWHGYLTVLKPLSIFFTYREIRYINMFIVNILLAAVAIMLYKHTGRQGGWINACAYIAAATSMFVLVVPISFHYMSSFVGMLLMTLAVILNYKKRWTGMAELFFACGMCINFIDLLTYPVVTLGVPLIVLLLLELQNDKTGFTAGLRRVIGLSVLWAAGYAASWVTKWVLASLVLKKNVLMDAASQAVLRVAGDAQQAADHREALRANFSNLNYLKWDMKVVVPVLCLLLVGIGFFLWRKNRKRAGKYALILLVCTYPYLWYLALANHSQVHCFFTFRAQMITVFGILAALFGMAGDLFCLVKNKDMRQEDMEDGAS